MNIRLHPWPLGDEKEKPVSGEFARKIAEQGEFNEKFKTSDVAKSRRSHRSLSPLSRFMR